MRQNLEQNGGLTILARIIAKAYLAESRFDKGVTKVRKRLEKEEDISRISEDSFDRVDDYQLE